MNIVHQIGDALYEALPPDVAHEHFVKARQATNDLAIDFAARLLHRFKEDAEREYAQKLDAAFRAREYLVENAELLNLFRHMRSLIKSLTPHN